jgi:phosphate transport system substrate-binding protein
MSINLRYCVVGLGLLSILLPSQPCLAADPAKPPIRVNGAAMASDQVQLCANEFMAANPTLNVVVTGSSAGKGFEALLEGTADIALASRLILPNEFEKATSKGINLANKQIGNAGMAVVTSPKNPLNEMTMDQLKQIFLAERRNWKELGGPDLPIRCITRRVPESGGAVLFMEKVLHNSPYGPTTVFADSWSAIMKICAAADDLPIGMGPVFIVRGEVKIIAIKKDQASVGIKPTVETLKDKSYPIIDPIFMYWDKRTENQDIQRFIDFCADKGLKAN